MENYTTGAGQNLLVHELKDCVGKNCVIHKPSDHHMKDWPTNWRADRYLMERVCPHGIGHPDPDDLMYKKIIMAPDDSVHGCDGCCNCPKQNT